MFKSQGRELVVVDLVAWRCFVLPKARFLWIFFVAKKSSVAMRGAVVGSGRWSCQDLMHSALTGPSLVTIQPAVALLTIFVVFFLASVSKKNSVTCHDGPRDRRFVMQTVGFGVWKRDLIERQQTCVLQGLGCSSYLGLECIRATVHLW